MCKFLSNIFCCCCKAKSKSNKHKKEGDSSENYDTNWKTPEYYDSQHHIRDTDIKTIQMDKKTYNGLEFRKSIIGKENYELVTEEPLGSGSFGNVYKVKTTTCGTVSAMKTMDMRERHNSFHSFKNEVNALNNCQHKNIIKLVDHFFVPNIMCFLLIELAEGGDLRKRLKNKHKLNKKGLAFNEMEAKNYFVQMANAMNYVHKNCLIHGDLKLDNVLITGNGDHEVIKVTDFGCANVGYTEGEGYIMREVAIGTIPYMSPEQIRVYICVNLKSPDAFRPKPPSLRYNPMKSDVWALGICLYRLFFYEIPFDFYSKTDTDVSAMKDMHKDMKNGIDPDPQLVKLLSNDCMDLIKSLINYNKNSRIDMKVVMNHNWVRNSPKLDKN